MVFSPLLEALLSSRTLRKKIVNRIESCRGWISFADYMDTVLYEPKLGYYSGGAVKFGSNGDFVTAPDMSFLYGHTLANAVIPIIRQTGRNILELGAGTGCLARDILNRLSASSILCQRYDIFEISSELCRRQQLMLAEYGQVNWLDALPTHFDGVLIANEVLDAMPVQLVVKRQTGWYELGVGYQEGAFIFDERPVCPVLAESIACQIPDGHLLPEGYITEVHTQACAFIQSLAKMLVTGKAGAAIFIDYGFPRREYYHPERTRGTLMCHYRHYAHTNPFFLPGLQDITAHLDFTTIAEIAEKQGLDVLCYTNLASFLIASGLIRERDVLFDQARDISSTLQLQAIQTFLSPAEMGELFKVLVLGHNIVPPAFMLEIDKSGRL